MNDLLENFPPKENYDGLRETKKCSEEKECDSMNRENQNPNIPKYRSDPSYFSNLMSQIEIINQLVDKLS